MANILNYLDAFGYRTLAQMPFSAVDNLILSQMSYGRYEKAADKLPAPLCEIASAVRGDFFRLDVQLLKKAAESERFKNMIPLLYVSKFSPEETLQFAAITFLLSDGTAYVAYRGTDNTIVGWKEDFNLSFTCPVPAQTEAVEYLNLVGRTLGCPLRVGGHSKGGNLAVYAAANCQTEVQDRILEVYSNDGPGHDLGTIQSEGYRRVDGRMKTFIPKSSIIGMLLEHRSDYTVVDSDARGLFQHSLYTWLLHGSGFVVLDSTSKLSACMNESIREWLKKMSVEKRKYMTDTVFDILSAGEAKTMRELSADYKNMQPVFTRAKELNAEDRHELMELASQFMRIAFSQYEQLALSQLSGLKAQFSEFIEKYTDRSDKKHGEAE